MRWWPADPRATTGDWNMTRRSAPFRKYDEMGAYHWAKCQRGSRWYSPPDEARYSLIAGRVRSAKSVLDLGCGDGYLTALAGRRAEKVVGIDAERSAVAIAAEKLAGYRNCSLALASCYELPFGSGDFDAVLLSDVLEHLEAPEACLREVCRVLTADGALLLTTPKWRPGKMWDPTYHVKEYKPEELTDMLNGWFGKVTLSFFAPAIWWRVRKRLGTGFMRFFARHLFNPFLENGSDPAKYTQILAVCERPRSKTA
jgi:SAM-dependent methyltransferase